MAQIASCKPNTAPFLTVHARLQPRTANRVGRVVCAARKRQQHDAGSHVFPGQRAQRFTVLHYLVDGATNFRLWWLKALCSSQIPPFA